MFIQSKFVPIFNCVDAVLELLSGLPFSLNDHEKLDARTVLSRHITQLKESIWVFIETPYVDKVYRDSYYHYFSTKFGGYTKHCIRLSFFESEVNHDSFRGEVDHSSIQNNFLGFIVIRPTAPQVIGRSVLSPRALKQLGFSTCLVKIPVTVNSIKLLAIGFPHSSQDTETITCAETTIWGLMEYFGNKYPDYSPVLPSEIVGILRSQSHERQWPSKGLVVEQISFALREFGFATRIYSESAYGSEFFRLLSCYVESGIPVVVAVQNDTGIGHALLCIGRASHSENDGSVPPSWLTSDNRTVEFMDNDDLARDFVFMDDNLPAYALAGLSTPTKNYSDADWKKCRISSFVVPLYEKVYLEAFEVKHLIKRFLLDGPVPLPDGTLVFLRVFLTSSRSYKQHVATKAAMAVGLRELITAMSLPKFIWVTELSIGSMEAGYVNGIILLDATEPNTNYFKPLILAAYQNTLLIFAKENVSGTNFAAISMNIQPFRSFEDNLHPN